MILPCEKCGRDVEIVPCPEGGQIVVHAADCPKPVVSLRTANRLRLGTVTSLDVHAGEQ